MQQFLVDANVFVAAIKNPGKKAGALDLILELISNEEIRLVGNDLLLLEFEKYYEKCSKYFSKDNIVDIVHAATCLQESSTIVTNDKHFDKIYNNKIIEVWSISKAIKILLSHREQV